MSRKTARRQELRRPKTRAALVAAGLKLLADRSISGISVENITQHASVAKGSFFNHFADKDDFASVVGMEICSGVEAKIALANREVTDPAIRIARGICSVVQFALTQRLAGKTFARLYTSNTGATQPFNAGIRSDVAHGVIEKRFPLIGTEAGVVCVTGAAQGLLASITKNNPKLDDAVRLSIDVLTVLLTGLGVESNEARYVSSSAARSLIVPCTSCDVRVTGPDDSP